MAKQLVSPFERHIEKAVVAVAALLLIGAVGRYLITSPNQVEIQGTMVSPANIDDELVTNAQAVRSRVVGVRSDVQAPPPVFDEFASFINPFDEAKLNEPFVASVAFGPSIPIIDPPTAVDGDKELVKVVALDKPIVTSGRSTMVFDDGFDETHQEVRNWAVVSLVFNREEQSKRQALAYGGSRKEVSFGPIELQRRAQGMGGIWSGEDWEMVDAQPSITVPTPPDLPIEEVDGQIQVPRKQYMALSDYYRALNLPELQLSILRPLGLEVFNGSPWAWPELVSHQELLVQEWDVVHPGEKPESQLDDRFGLVDEDPLTPITERNVEKTYEQKVEEAFLLIAEARKSRDLNQALTAYNLCFGVKNDIRASGRAKGLANKCIEQSELLEDDIRREKKTRRPNQRNTQSGDEDDESIRQRYPRQQIWIIDSKSDSIPSGKTYQYRMRVNIFNRLAGEPAKFANPDDAKVVFLASEWSPPTDPVRFENVSYMFASSFDQRKEKISIEVFQWFDGEWVKGRERFGIGEHMAFQTRATTRSLDDPEKAVKAKVDFETNSTVVDIDFDRAYREKKKGRTRDGIRLGAAGHECSVVFTDKYGELRERFVPFDKKHPSKAELGARIWKPATK